MKKSLIAKGALPFISAIASLLISSIALPSYANAEPTPSPTSSSTPVIDSYKTALEQFKIEREMYLSALRERSQQIRVINISFKNACDKAAMDFKTAMSAAKSPDQKNLANAARKSAISSAIAARDLAISALGAEPIAPIEPAKPQRVSAKNKSR